MTKKWIELINSYGPFSHSPWEGQGIRVTHEEGLEGRADFLVRTLRKLIKNKFSFVEIEKMTIVDVGCYDGWILHQLSDLPFKKMVGIEPREKNILKGKGIRKLLGIKTRVKFKIGDIDCLGKEKFDIVLCIGVLHHLESTGLAIRNLDEITKHMLVLDTICLPKKYLTQELASDLEIKDVIYQNKPKQFGLTGEKYESSYYDGSTSRTAVVTIPSISTLKMNMDILSYKQITVLADPESFRRAMKKNKRKFDEVLMYGIKTKNSSENAVAQLVNKYEYGLIHKLFDVSLVNSLYAHYLQNKKSISVSPAFSAMKASIDGRSVNLAVLKRYFRNPILFEIAKNMRFNPKDKIAFEYAKVLYAQKRYKEALRILELITQKINADWRSVYRSFYLMHLIYKKIGDKERSLYYAGMCKRCHMNFPLL